MEEACFEVMSSQTLHVSKVLTRPVRFCQLQIKLRQHSVGMYLEIYREGSKVQQDLWQIRFPLETELGITEKPATIRKATLRIS